MNILIVSHFYEKDGVMGSVRWTSFAHRLSKKHNVFVVTHEPDSSAPFIAENRNGITVLKIDNECFYVKRGNKKKSKKTGALDNNTNSLKLENTEVKKQVFSVKDSLRAIFYVLSMKKSAKRNAHLILSYLRNNDIKIDCLITTSRPFIDAFLGYYISKRINKPWILDQRDLQYSDGASDFTIQYYSNCFRKMDQFVSSYTLVSYGMADSFAKDCLFIRESEKKIKVLHNGYNAQQLSSSIDDKIEKSITISYVGDMYLGRRDADILFAAIRKVVDNHDDVSVNDFRFFYAGKEGSVVRLQAKKYDIENIVVDNGFVSHSKSIQLQQHSDILLLLTWNTEMDRGILPGKFYEYMMSQKPIICITCGSVPNGEAEQMMNEMNLGIAVNQLNYEDGVAKLSDYLFAQLKNKRQYNSTIYSPKHDLVSEYDYDNLTVKLESIIEAIT